MTPFKKITTAQLGCLVKIDLLYRSGESEHLEFDLVPDNQADYQRGFLGISTPLAKAILGNRLGSVIPYFTDELQAIRILSITDSTRKADPGALIDRENTIRETLSRIEFRDALLFASSTDTKWGEYDSDGLDYEKWKLNQENNRDGVKKNYDDQE